MLAITASDQVDIAGSNHPAPPAGLRAARGGATVVRVESPQERKAANEAVFREVNEQVVELQERFSVENGEPLSLVCECDRLGCAELLRVSLATYEAIRADGACFLVVPGHEDLSVEEVVDAFDGCTIVRKRAGEPREVALETDPRA
jgi:hypothetical protein